jgi:hypothetical protein
VAFEPGYSWKYSLEQLLRQSCWALWLTPTIPATWEVESGRIEVKCQSGKNLARLHLDQ